MDRNREEPERVDLDLNEFEVVRSEFFAHTHEPSFVFNDGKVGVNTACVKRLPSVEYVQILINRDKRKLAVRPCLEEDIFSTPWARVKDGKPMPRHITAKIFFMKVFDLMGWNPDYRYKILGKLIRANDEQIFLFDLPSAETYRRSVGEDGKRTGSRKPVFPAEWKNQFGIPFSEHKKALQVNLIDGYTVYSMKEKKHTEKGAGDDAGNGPESADDGD